MSIKVQSVYGASKHMQKVTDAPAAVTLVTSEEIRRYGYRTLGDVLRSVPGFYITYDRNYTFAAVQGFGRTGDYNSRILTLVDGHRINDDIYGETLLGTEFPIDLDLIDRVEIIHGPSSSIYGSNAFLAVINIITKRAELSKGLEVAGAASSYDTGYTRITYGRKSQKGWGALLSSSFYDSHGQRSLFFKEFNTPSTNYGIAQDSDLDRSKQMFASVFYKDLHLQAAYGRREKQIPTASFGTVFGGPREETNDNRGYVDLSYDHKFRKDLDLTARVFFDSYTYDGNYPYRYDPSRSTITLNHDYSNGAWWGEEIKLSKPIFTKHLLTVGHEYRDNFRVTQSNFDLSPFVLYLNNHSPSSVWAFYAQDEYSIRKNLLLNVGVRHDQDYSFGGSTNPRLALMYSPLAQTTLKFLYGTAFRAPNAYELYYQTPASSLPNPKLRPETIRTAEFVVEQYVRDRYRLSGDIFQNQIEHLIDQEALPGGLLRFQNVNPVRATGVELTFERKWTSGLGTQLNYTYEHAVDQRTGGLLQNTPAHLANANLLVPLLPRKLTAGLDLHYVSSRRTLAGNIASRFVLANLTLFSEHLFKGFQLSGTVYNLFDARYGYPGGSEHQEDILYQDGINARLKLEYRFGGRAR